MAMRDLVTGGAACAVPGSSSSSNPFGALANAMIGSSSKTQVTLPLSLSLSLHRIMCQHIIVSIILPVFMIFDLVSTRKHLSFHFCIALGMRSS